MRRAPAPLRRRSLVWRTISLAAAWLWAGAVVALIYGYHVAQPSSPWMVADGHTYSTHPPAQTLATLIFDGVLEAFPGLRIGVIEQGAIWVPSWLHQMESAFDAFSRHEERLRALSLRPSDYVHRQVRFTPYPTEDLGWIVAQGGSDLVLFSSDYPHVEGGRRPVERFEASLGDAGEDVRDAFYAFCALEEVRGADGGLRLAPVRVVGSHNCKARKAEVRHRSRRRSYIEGIARRD